jgi:hypothetical protein
MCKVATPINIGATLKSGKFSGGTKLSEGFLALNEGNEGLPALFIHDVTYTTF